ncbi:MAG: DJ-1/PfpI family protein [Tissierellia bacterium]|nr:DJ-1/PfpI family protein [Tissierellia bacterium]
MKALVFMADGSEDIEALTQVDFLRRVKIDVDVVSLNENKIIETSHKVRILCDKFVDEVVDNNYDAIIIPGGLPGATNLGDDNRVLEILKRHYENKKLVCAICAGPYALDKAGILNDRNYTCYPGFEMNIKNGKHIDQNVVVDENVITGKGPALATLFAFSIIENLLGTDAVNSLKAEVLWKDLEK